MTIGVFAWASFGVWIGVSDALSVPLLESAIEKCVFNKPCSSSCVWGWIWSREQNCVPESWLWLWRWHWRSHASLKSVKVLKMPSLSIAHFTSRFLVGKQTAHFSLLRHAIRWERAIPIHPKLRPGLVPAPIRSHNRAYTFLTDVWPKSHEYTFCTSLCRFISRHRAPFITLISSSGSGNWKSINQAKRENLICG